VASAAPHVHPGEKCPTCERKVPHPRAKTEKPRNKAKWSLHVPKDEQENGIDILQTLVREAAIELGRPEDCPPYFVLVEALHFFLTTPKAKAA
jgi:hypothetical protein